MCTAVFINPFGLQVGMAVIDHNTGTTVLAYDPVSFSKPSFHEQKIILVSVKIFYVSFIPAIMFVSVVRRAGNHQIYAFIWNLFHQLQTVTAYYSVHEIFRESNFYHLIPNVLQRSTFLLLPSLAQIRISADRAQVVLIRVENARFDCFVDVTQQPFQSSNIFLCACSGDLLDLRSLGPDHDIES